MGLRQRSETLNPVLLRELAEATRHRNFLLFVTGFSMVLLLAVVVSWPAPDERSSSRYSWRSGEVLFATFITLAGFMLVLLVPSFSFDTITGERERGTLDLLLISPLSAREIIEGKTHATVLLGALFLMITTPFLFMVYLLGGTPLYVVLFSYGGLILMTLLLASLGTLTSALASKTWQSAVATFVIGFGVLFLTGLVLESSDGSDGDDALGTFWRLIMGGLDEYPYGLARLLLVTIAVSAIRHLVVVVDTQSENKGLRPLVPLLLFFLFLYSLSIWGLNTNMAGGLLGMFLFMSLLMTTLFVIRRTFMGGLDTADLTSDVAFLITFGLLLVVVALDVGERPFRLVSRYDSNVVSIAFELFVLALRELWLVTLLLSTFVGIALLWLPVLVSIAVLGTMELLGLTSWLTKVLDTPGDVGVVLPFIICLVAFSLGLYNIMTELGSRRLVTSARHLPQEVPNEAPVKPVLEGEIP